MRKQVTFVYAGALTTLIALVWVTGSLWTGVFALKPTSFADSSGSAVEVADESERGLAGAAAAPAAKSSSGPARIQIVDVATTSGREAEQTTIPF